MSAGPCTPRPASASAVARRSPLEPPPAAARRGGDRHQTSTPVPSSPECSATSAAAAASSGTDWEPGSLSVREKNPGSSSVPTATTGTPRDSRPPGWRGRPGSPWDRRRRRRPASEPARRDRPRRRGSRPEPLSGRRTARTHTGWTPPIRPWRTTRIPRRRPRASSRRRWSPPTRPRRAPPPASAATLRTPALVPSASRPVASSPDEDPPVSDGDRPPGPRRSRGRPSRTLPHLDVLRVRQAVLMSVDSRATTDARPPARPPPPVETSRRARMRCDGRRRAWADRTVGLPAPPAPARTACVERGPTVARDGRLRARAPASAWPWLDRSRPQP